MMEKPLVIFGIGDAAQVAYYLFTTDAGWKIAGFTVDAAYLNGDTFEGLPVVPFEEIVHKFPPNQFDMFIATGYNKMNKIREAKYKQAKQLGYTLRTYVSSRCTYLSQYPPGDNCFIFENNTIQPFVQLGSNIVLWSGNHIGHHSVIEDHNFLTSHVVVSGRCHIEPNCFIGVNASLRDAIRIRRETLIGAGAVVMKDTVEKGVYLPQRAVLFDKTSDQIEI
jgi:sugar O-acyltransferase (sialic acid O-acetyltransferase NeuD family)